MARFAFGLVGAAFVLRLVLVFLPELGRDEAAYLYWTYHPRLDYAPLLHLQIFLARIISDAPWFLRLSQLVIAGFTVFLFGQWMRSRNQVPCGGAAALASIPWLVFAGGVLHPDGLLVLGLVAFALGLETRRSWIVVLGAVVCAGAKLTGFLPAGIALIWILRRRDWGPLAVLGGAVIGYGLLLRPETFEVARQFARIEQGPLARIGILLLEIALLGGALVIVPRLRRSPVAWTGLLLVGGFGAAAILGGQVKANWLLPGLLLLWSTRIPRGVLIASAVGGILLSGAMVAGYAMPSLARSAERQLDRSGILPEYSVLAGAREARAASARSWGDYLAGFHARIEWPDLPLVPDVIVSDDYGLACRLALACPETVPVVVIPGDPLFGRELADLPGRQLIVAVRAELPHPEPVVWEATMTHPVTGDSISLRLVGEP